MKLTCVTLSGGLCLHIDFGQVIAEDGWEGEEFLFPWFPLLEVTSGCVFLMEGQCLSQVCKNYMAPFGKSH